jgi:nicotinamide-nucleotide amidase
MNAEIIAIGTELLLGEIADTNTRVIARMLRDLGLDLFRTTTVGDNLERIAGAVRESLARSQVVITTGGLGPTVDDPTREAIAAAINVTTEFVPELWEQIQERFAQYGRAPTENNRRQAFVPAGAIPISNPVGTAPAFIVETDGQSIISLPGVPGEMAVLLEQAVVPYLRRRFDLRSVIRTRVIHTAGTGESKVDDLIQDLEQLSNPTVGLAAHGGRVDVRIAAKGEDPAELDRAIGDLETVVRQRLGKCVFGVDEDTLEAAALRATVSRGWRLVSLERGTGGALAAALGSAGAGYAGGEILPDASDEQDIGHALARRCQSEEAQVGLALDLVQASPGNRLIVVLRTPDGDEVVERKYGGPPANARETAVNLALELLRRRCS